PYSNNWNNGTFINTFYKIDVTSYPVSISTVISTGTTPSVRCSVSSIFDDTGKLYIWGGVAYVVDQAMYIFDTFTSTWSRILPSYVPVQRWGYSVTLKDGKIYYIGGVIEGLPNIKSADIREILIYDTLNADNNPWTIKNATYNSNINDRYRHSAVLAPNNQSIILYGGSMSNASGVPPDYLITLDLQTFEISELVTKNGPNIVDVPAYFTSVIYNNYMIAYLGYFKTANPYRQAIKILDLSQTTYTWVDKFIATPSTSSSSPARSTSTSSPVPLPDDSNNNKKTIVIVSTVGSIVVVLLASFIVFILCNRKRKQKQATNTASNTGLPVQVNPAMHNNSNNQNTISQVPFNQNQFNNDTLTSNFAQNNFTDHRASLAFKPDS
ncbi:5845_t:CDS:2, partial [Ambispora leptoticha]